ncbi:FG-GAP-like repeat-containing protein [Actinoplanes sichuanensis]|nr:FG-GAP-like repeat-containing protein [Actinoplanes sichuanensis]
MAAVTPVSGAPAHAADEPQPVVEDYAYPGADRILADHGLKILTGDGRIRHVADCTGRDDVFRVESLAGSSLRTHCFEVLGPRGFVTMDVPNVFLVQGADRTVIAKATYRGETETVTVPPDGYEPIGGGNATHTLVELRVAGTDPLPAGPAAAQPYVAKIDAGGRGCTAVLVAAEWLATSKACLGDTLPQPATAIIGRADLLRSGGTERAITELLPRADRDLTLARLDQPVTDITPVTLGATAPAVAGTIQSSGYGRGADGWPATAVRTSGFTVAEVDPSTLTLARAGGAGTCKGDAGGPVLRTTGDTVELVAIQAKSWQTGCAGVTETRDAAVAVRTDDLAGWIRENTVDACQTTVESGFTALYDGRSAPRDRWSPAVAESNCTFRADGGASLVRYTGGRAPLAYTLRADWKATSATSDAGVIVGATAGGDTARGIEVQIKPGGTGDTATGAITGRNAPTSDAQRPVGSWNAFEITVAGRRVTVRLNGTVVNDYQVTDPALLLAAGSIALQADPAGSPVWFRNIRLRTDNAGFTTGTVPVLYDYGNGLTRLWQLQGVGGQQPTVTGRVAWDSGTGNWEAARTKPVSGDFTGDGTLDLGLFYNYGNSRTALFVFDGITGTGNVTGRLVWDSGVGSWDWNRIRAVGGDFNGDGRAEIGAFYNYDGAQTRLFVFDDIASGVVVRQTWDSGAGAWDGTRAKYVAGDFNGDGRAEIGGFYNYPGAQTKLWIYDSVSTGALTRLAWDSGAGNWDWNRIKLTGGDFNGDGRADIGAFYNYDGARTRLFVFDASGPTASARQSWDSGAGAWDWNRIKAVTGDFNGDGRTEIGAFYNYDNSLTRLFVFDGIGGNAAARQVWDSTQGGWDWNRMITLT